MGPSNGPRWNREGLGPGWGREFTGDAGVPGGRGGCRGEAMGVVRLSAEEGQWGRARWRAVERRLGVLFLLQAGWG